MQLGRRHTDNISGNREYTVLSRRILIPEVSPKELNYIEDALGHEQFLKTQCQEAIQNLQDPTLKNQVQQMTQKHQQIFDNFYNLV